MFCQCHWSLPMWGPLPTAGVQCWGHQRLQYGTISACRWSCWCQFCWLVLFPMSQKMFYDTALLLKLFILTACSMGPGPGPSQSTRSWNPFRIAHALCHFFIVPLTKYISLDRLLWAEESSEALDSSLKTDPCKTNPASYPDIRTQDRWTRFCLSWEPRHAAAAVKLTDSQSLSGNRNILFCVSGNPESDHFSPPLLQCPVQATVPFLLMTSPASEQHPLPPLLPPLPLLAVLNTATRVISWKHKPDHVTPLLEFLQWLPVWKSKSLQGFQSFTLTDP